MLARPTTEQVILDCRRELLETVAPAVSSPPVAIAIQMLENVLRNCATRAAHEIAWMREESEAMVALARHAIDVLGDADDVYRALAAYDAGRSDSLHLDEVAATYSLAGHCLSATLEAAMAEPVPELVERGRALLDQRLANETQIMGEWAFVGRG